MIAVNQIGVATELVNTLFMATVGALALALGLSFGLGGRETAAQIVRGARRPEHGGADPIAEPVETEPLAGMSLAPARHS